MSFKIYSYEHIFKQPVDMKFNSAWDKLNDNLEKNQFKNIIENIYQEVSFFLFRASTVIDLKSTKTFFDLGSLNGIESSFVAQLMPNCKVYSFEARDSAAKMVQDNLKRYTNAKCICSAVGDKNDTIEFFITPDNIGASSALEPTGGPAGSNSEKTSVPCVRLDTFCENEKIDSIDLIWMDLQGFEIKALEGLGNLLDTTKAIHTEACKIAYYKDQPIINELKDYLENKGFIMDNYKRPFNYGGDINIHKYEGDIIFLRK